MARDTSQILARRARPSPATLRVAASPASGRGVKNCFLAVFAAALLMAGAGRADPGGPHPDQPVPVRVGEPRADPVVSHVAQPVPVRVGDHTGFGRLVFDFISPVTWHIARDGEQVTVHFDPASTIAAAPYLPRNVYAMTQDADGVELTVVEGARLRTMRLSNRLVLDVLDPLSDRPAKVPPARTPAARKLVWPDLPIDRHDSSPVTPAVTAAAPAPVAAPAVQKAPSSSLAAAPTLAQPSGTGSGPMALAATKAAKPPATTSAVLFPFESTVGAAAFRRGGQAVLLFDQPRPLDLAALRDDPVFGAAVVHVLPGATLVLLPLTPGLQLTLQHERYGWRVAVGPARAMAPPIGVAERDGGLAFAVHDPGRTVSIVDPDSGATVLVGTEIDGAQGFAVDRRAPQFVLWQTWQGIAVEPLSDRLALQTLNGGFALTVDGGSLAMTPANAEAAALANAVGLTRRFHLPELPVTALRDRLRDQVAEAAAAPPLSRGRTLEAAARTMIALGWGAEAAAELRLAAMTAPQEADRPGPAGLGAVAALLAWRPEQARAIEDPRLSGSDEVTLWRAVRDAELHTATQRAAFEFAATWPLILTYRPALQARLLPLAAETMVAGGASKQAATLLAGSPHDPALALARGMLAQSDGHTDAALAMYDALSVGKDRLVRVRAARRAIELRLASGKIDVARAADEMEKLLVAWQGDERELSLRERLAELRARAGRWRSALTLLRATERDFSKQAADIHARMQRIFATAIGDGRSDALPPLEFVALVDENADLLPSGPEGDALAGRLADRLLLLDLPEQAEPLLAKLMRATAPGAGRAGIGERLAELRLRQGNAVGALAALSDSSADNLPADLTERRTLLLAKAEARNGDVPGAVAALSALHMAAADETRATILEQAQEWAGAEGALRDYVAKTVPDTGRLDDTQRRTLIRLAADAGRAGDQAGLATLRDQDDSRMGTGPLADMFRLLTAGPVQGVADLRRSAQEAVLAHALPQDLKAVR
jgi:hypothetical protein